MSTTPDSPTSLAVALAPEVTVSDAVLDALVPELCQLHRGASLEHALRLARLVVDRLYGGDLAAWRQRGPKEGSFRKLATRLDGLGVPGLSSGNLARAVSALEVDLRVGVSGRRQLSIAHVNAVAGLPEAAQERLLGEAEARDLTAAELRREADAVRRASATPGRSGRPRLPGFVRTVNRWERELEDETSTFGDLEQAAGLAEEEARRVRRVVESMRARCEALLAQLPSAD